MPTAEHADFEEEEDVDEEEEEDVVVDIVVAELVPTLPVVDAARNGTDGSFGTAFGAAFGTAVAGIAAIAAVAGSSTIFCCFARRQEHRAPPCILLQCANCIHSTGAFDCWTSLRRPPLRRRVPCGSTDFAAASTLVAWREFCFPASADEKTCCFIVAAYMAGSMCTRGSTWSGCCDFMCRFSTCLYPNSLLHTPHTNTLLVLVLLLLLLLFALRCGFDPCVTPRGASTTIACVDPTSRRPPAALVFFLLFAAGSPETDPEVDSAANPTNRSAATVTVSAAAVAATVDIEDDNIEDGNNDGDRDHAPPVARYRVAVCEGDALRGEFPGVDSGDDFGGPSDASSISSSDVSLSSPFRFRFTSTVAAAAVAAAASSELVVVWYSFLDPAPPAFRFLPRPHPRPHKEERRGRSTGLGKSTSPSRSSSPPPSSLIILTPPFSSLPAPQPTADALAATAGWLPLYLMM